jgi:hypothetical protein
MRVIPNDSGSEVRITLLQTENLSEQQFAEDAKLVQNDLRTQKQLLEGGQAELAANDSPPPTAIRPDKRYRR